MSETNTAAGTFGLRRWWPVIPAVIAIAVYAFLGIYSVQPLGAIPDGGTIVVYRSTGEPFFNSPDALCIKRMGDVSLMCRGMAMEEAPLDRIVLRLPYQAWAFKASVR